MRILHVLLGALFLAGFPCPASPATITIDAEKDLVPVNPLLFGTNLHANDEAGEPIKAFIRDVGLSLFRYPDGGGYYYLERPGDGWGSGQAGRGANDKLAASYLGCFKNVARFAAETGCRLTACVNVENGSVDAAVAWVRYAKQEKLGITHWCLGNEVYYDEQLKKPQNYAACIQKFATALKQADPSIKIGMDFGNAYENRQHQWAERILRAAGEHIDFIDVHWYAGRSNSGAADWSIIVASPLRIAEDVREFRQLVRSCVPGRTIEVCYLEWGIFAKEPGQQSLANALFTADCLGQLHLAQVTMACNYNLQEKIFGLIPGWCAAEGWGGNPWNGRTVRPKALAIKLWTTHMARGGLVDTRVADCGTLTQSSTWHSLLNYTGREFPALSAYCTRDEGRGRLTLMVINKKPDSAVEAEVAVSGFVRLPTAKAATLNGPDYLSHNDDGSTYRSVTPAPAVTVRITESVIDAAGAAFRYKFPAHSITVIELLARQEGK
jgi:alpha-L-arabinofuranosidase